jgi:hypothetical protein
MTTTVVVYSDETDPDIRLAWYDNDDPATLRNLSGWTLAVEVVDPETNVIALTKTTGINGGDGSGASNVNIAWTAAELDTIDGATYKLRVTATLATEKAVFTVDSRGTLPLLTVITKPAAA